jgi:2-methylcitrate dehydratase PrpD
LTLAEALGGFAIDFEGEAMTPDAIASAQKMILDTLATSLAGVDQPGVREARATALRYGGAEEATLLVTGQRVPAPMAAMINATMAHAWDLDDIHIPSALHVMGVVFPAALAQAERVNADGRSLLEAVVLGVEAACRMGRAYHRRRQGVTGRGFLPTSMVAGFGGVVAAGRLASLSLPQMVHAMGLHYSQLCGNRQALLDAALAKRMQPAFAARSALWACDLAEVGTTGPKRCLEGDAGLFRLYLGAEPPTADELLQPREGFEIESCSVKRFACCGAAHPLIEAALDLAEAHDLQPDRIERVELYFGPDGNGLVGRPFVMGDHPQVNAQFSAPYGVAVALCHRSADLRHFTDEAVRADNLVAEFATRRVAIVKSIENPPLPRSSVPSDWPAHAGKPHVVTISLADGSVVRAERAACETLGPARAGFDDVRRKLHACADFDGRWSTAELDALAETVANLDDAVDVRGLVRATFAAAPAATAPRIPTKLDTRNG